MDRADRAAIPTAIQHMLPSQQPYPHLAREKARTELAGVQARRSPRLPSQKPSPTWRTSKHSHRSRGRERDAHPGCHPSSHSLLGAQESTSSAHGGASATLTQAAKVLDALPGKTRALQAAAAASAQPSVRGRAGPARMLDKHGALRLTRCSGPEELAACRRQSTPHGHAASSPASRTGSQPGTSGSSSPQKSPGRSAGRQVHQASDQA